MNWSNCYSILLISSLLCRCGNKLLSKYFKCTFNILFKFSHCWQQMIDRVRLKRNCGVASVGEETQKIVFFFTIGPLSQFTTIERSWSSHLSKHVALCQFELRQRIADLLCQRASAQNISLSTLIFIVSFQVHSCNSQFNTNKTKFSLSATLLNQTWFSAAKWEHICNQ